MYNDPNAQQPPYGQPPYISPYEQQYSQQPPVTPYPPPTQYGTPGYPPGYPPTYPVQPQKQSNKTLWIVLGIIGGVFVLIIGSCAAILYSIEQSASTFSHNLRATVTANEPAPQQQAQDYYLAISVQDYTGAYNYLAPNITLSDGTTLTQSSFTQQAQALDTSDGRVTNYTATADPNDATKVTVQVTRSGGKSYTVHLSFTQGSYQWEISSFDAI